MEQTALVTGGAGFVGKYFCKRLVDLGYHTLCVDNLMSEGARVPSAWPEFQRCEVDFRHQDCRDFFDDPANKREYALIIHLAAVVGGRATIENAPLEVSQDLSIDAAFFNWLTKLPVKPKKVIYFSSSAVYPIDLQTIEKHGILAENMLSFSNTMIGIPDMTYGWAKMTGEYLSKMAHDVYGIDIVCYRPFSGYSETQNEVYPFIGILKRVLRREAEIDIWSNSVRDFIHMDDVVDCVFRTMNHINDGSAMNIGTGRPTSFSELAQIMMTEADHHVAVHICNDKPAGVFYRVADTTKVEQMGWKSTITVEEGVRRAVLYLRQDETEK